MGDHKQYFDQAKDKFRITGVGGIQLPNPDLTQSPHVPNKTEAKRQVIFKNGWVMVGGKMVKQKSEESPIKILDMSSKIIDQRKADAAKKDKQDNNSDNQ